MRRGACEAQNISSWRQWQSRPNRIDNNRPSSLGTDVPHWLRLVVARVHFVDSLLSQIMPLAPSSAYQGLSLTAGDPSEVRHGSEALHRRLGFFDIHRAIA